MPLYTTDDEDDSVIDPPVYIVDNNASAPVYEEDNSVQSLIIDIDGEPWVVNYYSQILSSTDSPKILDLELDPTLQQYVHVNSFRISVTDELSSDTEATTGTTTVTGSGLIYPNTIVPNVGDMFVSQMTRGFKGVFTVTSVKRESFYAKSAWTIEYRLFEQLNQAIDANLKLKVVNNLFFDKNRLAAGKPPLVSYTVINKESVYREQIEWLVDRLYQEFYDARLETFVYNHNEYDTVYDPFAVSFFNRIIDRQYLNAYHYPKEYSIGMDAIHKKPTLWRAILNASGTGLAYLYPRKFNLMSVSTLGVAYTQSSIAHTTIGYVPLPEKFTSDFTVNTAEESYVLSHAFYDGDIANGSLMDNAILTAVSGNVVSNADLDAIIEGIKTANGKTLFYSLILTIALLNIRLTES